MSTKEVVTGGEVTELAIWLLPYRVYGYETDDMDFTPRGEVCVSLNGVEVLQNEGFSKGWRSNDLCAETESELDESYLLLVR